MLKPMLQKLGPNKPWQFWYASDSMSNGISIEVRVTNDEEGPHFSCHAWDLGTETNLMYEAQYMLDLETVEAAAESQVEIDEWKLANKTFKMFAVNGMHVKGPGSHFVASAEECVADAYKRYEALQFIVDLSRSM